MPYYSTAHITVDGKYKMCCYQNPEYAVDFFSSWKRYVTSESYVNEAVRYMQQWKQHPACKPCYDLEKTWIISPRELFNSQFKDDFLCQGPEMVGTIKRINIRFSNICNLACRMCNSFSSTGRIWIDKKLGIPASPMVPLPRKIKDFLYKKENISQFEHIDIKWWEPFLHEEHFLFLEHLIDSWYSKNIELFYNTNATILPGINGYSFVLPKGYSSIFDMLKKFKKVGIGLSIDAFGKDNDYIRIWSKWDDIIKNIKELQKHNYINLRITSTIMIDNVLSFPNLLLFAESLKIPVEVSWWSYVTKPEFLDIRIIPNRFKEKIDSHYLKIIKKYTLSQNNLNILNSIIKFMYSEKSNKVIFKKYMENNRIIDSFLI